MVTRIRMMSTLGLEVRALSLGLGLAEWCRAGQAAKSDYGCPDDRLLYLGAIDPTNFQGTVGIGS